MSPAPPATNSSCNPAHANRLWPAGGTFSARGSKVRRSSDHDRVNCRLGTRTVDAFQLLQRLLLLLSRLLVSYRPLANVEERRRRSRRNHTLGEKIMIEQVASSARQSLSAAKATSLPALREDTAGSHCPQAELGAATTTTAHRRDDKRRQHDCVVLPSPAAARAAAEKTLARRPPRKISKQTQVRPSRRSA